MHGPIHLLTAAFAHVPSLGVHPMQHAIAAPATAHVLILHSGRPAGQQHPCSPPFASMHMHPAAGQHKTSRPQAHYPPDRSLPVCPATKCIKAHGHSNAVWSSKQALATLTHTTTLPCVATASRLTHPGSVPGSVPALHQHQHPVRHRHTPATCHHVLPVQLLGVVHRPAGRQSLSLPSAEQHGLGKPHAGAATPHPRRTTSATRPAPWRRTPGSPAWPCCG